MTSEKRFSSLLTELGMNIPVVDEATGKKSAAGSALALPQHNAAAKRLVDDAIDVASLVYPDLDREEARNRMRKRLVTVGGNVLFPVDFGAEIVEIDGVKDLKVATTVNIPGVGDVEVVPLITLGVDYVGQTPDGRFASIGALQCLLFEPKNKNSKKPLYKAFPLGLASESVLQTWNFVASQMPTLNWPVIEHIPNVLRKAGSRKITFAPKCLKEMEFKNTKRVRSKGKWVDEPVTETVHVVGWLFGQMLKLHPRSQLPTVPVLDENGQPKKEDGVLLEKLDRRNLIWRVKLGEGSLELTLIGVEGEYKDDVRVPIVEMRNEMDPFVALGTTALKVDIQTIGQSAHAWLTRPYDNMNPLYVYARDSGLVTENDSRETMRAIIEELGRTAVQKIRDEMQDSYDEVTARLSTAADKPTLEQVLDGRLLKVVLYRMNKDDAAAAWIDSKIEGNFDPKSPFHMAVRRYVICQIADQSNYKDPENKPEAPKPPAQEDVVTTPNAPTEKLEAAAPPSPETVTDVAADKPKRGSKGKKAGDVAGSPA